MGSDPFTPTSRRNYKYFNPRSPCGERQTTRCLRGWSYRFQSTLPVWGATYTGRQRRPRNYISIHAPRVGSDPSSMPSVTERTHFNPRSPCGERRAARAGPPLRRNFNPRSPCGERLFALCYKATNSHFNPRSPCGERRRGRGGVSAGVADFNPRSPCGERRRFSTNAAIRYPFQSTLPVWGATITIPTVAKSRSISIHAPRVGSDRGGAIVPP